MLLFPPSMNIINDDPPSNPHPPTAFGGGLLTAPPSGVPKRKSRSRFALLPQPVRDELNHKLDDGWQYEQIREWLFGEKADGDIPALELKAGDPYSLVWTRTTPDETIIIRNFGVALSSWYHTHFPRWRDEQAERDESLRLIESVDRLTTAATTPNRAASHLGGNLLLRTMLLEAVRRVRNSDNAPTQLARLAHAWARLSQTDEHNLDIGKEALLEEIRANPDALAHARQMFAAIDAVKKPSTS
jgi:hypothetical protein